MTASDEVDLELALLRRQLERERRARLTAETVGEAATAELWHTVEQLRTVQRELEAKAEQLGLSHRLAREVRLDLEPHEILAGAVAAVGDALEVDRCLVRLADADSMGPIMGQWTAAGVVPLPTSILMPAGLERLAIAASSDHVGLWIDDVHTDQRLVGGYGEEIFEVLGCRSYAGAPMLAGSKLVGWLVVQATTELRAWTQRDREVLAGMAHDLGGAMLQALAREQQTQTLRELEAVDGAKSEFVSRVSHEVRTPLASISGYLEMMSDEVFGPVSGEQRNVLHTVRRNCDRIMGMVDNLLALARVDVGGTELEHVAVDPLAIVADVQLSVAPLLIARGVSLVVASTPVPGGFSGSPHDVERVLMNLLSNAIKFTPSGGTVNLTTERVDHSVVFRVADSGIGIPIADQQQLYRRFFRSSNAIEQGIPGTGLGLSLVKSIVDAHSGTIDVDSTPGEGTTFTVRFPISPG